MAEPNDETEGFRGVLLNKAVSFVSDPEPVVPLIEVEVEPEAEAEGAGGGPETDVADAPDVRLAWVAPADKGDGPGNEPLLPSVPIGAM